MNTPKRVNFTENDKQLLLDIIKKRQIHKKKILIKKSEIWIKIAEEYNSQCESEPRCIKQFKVFYDNAKRNTRKEAASQHVNLI
ncbi:hypothetical protein ABEB36_014029 [Hypothenemus hampei]|uniref:Regulatory protein zeste n=1 Tax=Hypothenemus hampei TaxID=57062 RepID=A0ABD1E336_HYPHA